MGRHERDATAGRKHEICEGNECGYRKERRYEVMASRYYFGVLFCSVHYCVIKMRDGDTFPRSAISGFKYVREGEPGCAYYLLSRTKGPRFSRNQFPLHLAEFPNVTCLIYCHEQADIHPP
jgi:hypothetical protein